MTTRSDGAAPLHHINPGAADPGMPDEMVESIVRSVQHDVLLAANGCPVEAFCLMLTALGEFIEQTDAPVDLLTMAIEQLTEQRDEALALGFAPVLVLRPDAPEMAS